MSAKKSAGRNMSVLSEREEPIYIEESLKSRWRGGKQRK